MAASLHVVILKPSKYMPDGYVERFRWGFMPNSTLPHVRSMTPARVDGARVDIHTIDEYVHTDLEYLSLLHPSVRGRTLLALVGVQSNQFHRALDLAAYGRRSGCMVVIGGPHTMTCDTSVLHGCGISFALAEAELVWPQILHDAAGGELRPVYGQEQRWQHELEAPVIVPPSRKDLRRYVVPMLGVYPVRGCPFLCNFCSVIKIAGRRIRSQSIATTMASLRAAKSAGVRMIMFTSDNFNKYPEAEALLEAVVEERLDLGLFVQCDTQIARQEHLVALLGKAGCYQMFVGVESFSRQNLLSTQKGQNHPETYRDIVRLCREHRIGSHFSNMIGFPQDTEREVHEHLEQLREIGPNWASFYVLTPIPGTAQYDAFLAQGLLVENNLDRFDTTCLTWRHSAFSGKQLYGLLLDCYRQFFSMGHALRNVKELSARNRKMLGSAAKNMMMSLFIRTLHMAAETSHVGRRQACAPGRCQRFHHAAERSVRLRAGAAAAELAAVGRREPAEPPDQPARAAGSLPLKQSGVWPRQAHIVAVARLTRWLRSQVLGLVPDQTAGRDAVRSSSSHRQTARRRRPLSSALRERSRRSSAPNGRGA